MRIKPAPDDLIERVALGMNLVPLPGAYALYGMLCKRHETLKAHSPDELAGYMTEAGFSAPKRTKIRRIPDQDLYPATAA
jgi:hypothetical protein